MSQVPSHGPPPEGPFFIYYEDDTDTFAVHWRGTEWGSEHHADLRGWYHDPLSEEGYRYLLRHYGLSAVDFPFERLKNMTPEELETARKAEHPVPYVLITRENVERDAEVIGEENRLRRANNNGRRVFATDVRRDFGEHEIADPVWRAPAIFSTGNGGLEVGTFTEFSGQDRHKHEHSIEIYTVLKGKLQIYIDDGGPHQLEAGDEVVILPGTIHEVVQRKREGGQPGEDFELLVRVHAVRCHGDQDKFVQMKSGGPWRKWADLPKSERADAYKKQP